MLATPKPHANAFVKGPHIPRFTSHPDFKLTMLPNGWALALVDITPELATEMLSRNVDNQRPLLTGTIDRYALDMANGSWRLTHQGIAFDESGRLHDGQHRLSAVVAAGTTVRFFVFFGAGGRPEMAVIDTQRVRSLNDSARVVGLDATKRQIATANAMIRFGIKNGYGTINRMTRTDRLAVIDRHHDVLKLADSWFGSSKMGVKLGAAPVIAAIACAAYHHDHAKLARFSAVVTEQAEPEKHEVAAKSLRQFLVTAIRPAPQEVFLKTCRAIQHFIAGSEPGRCIYACPENPFPIPGQPSLTDITA